jgi:hypothetical protein
LARENTIMTIANSLTLNTMLAICAVGALPTAPLRFSPELVSGGQKAPLQLRDRSIIAARPEAARSGQGVCVRCYRSTDLGRTWQAYSIIAEDGDPRTNLGDGHLMMLANGTLLYSYRQNRFAGLSIGDKSFSIRVAFSEDQGRSWAYHSTVESKVGTESGLWSSYLLEKADGTLQCYYDDEQTPALESFPRHQWSSMKTWNACSRSWENRVTVSRASGVKLSRDGMCSVAETLPGRLVCVCEGVQEAPPHRGCLWIVDSADGGKTWGGRRKLYEPKDTDFNALAPWMVRFASGLLVVVFTTDEDRDQPAVPSKGVLFQSVKYLTSTDGGKTWAGPNVMDDQVPDYFPGACAVWDGTQSQKLFVQYFRQPSHRCRVGGLTK